MVLADVGAERRLRGGDGYATSLWTGLGVRQTFTRDWNAGLFTRLWDNPPRWRRTADADPLGRSVAVKVRRGIGPGWLTLGGKSLPRNGAEDPQPALDLAHAFRCVFGADVGTGLEPFASGQPEPGRVSTMSTRSSGSVGMTGPGVPA